MQLGDDVYTSVRRWPRQDRWILGRQLTRAADSIAANIAEAYGRQSTGEKRFFLGVARGSTRETECLLQKALQRNLLDKHAGPGIRANAVIVGKMLTRLIASIRD